MSGTPTPFFDLALQWTQSMLVTAGLITGPILIVGLVVGLVIGLLQAATQIQEMTLTFLPKILAIALLLIFAGPWFLHLLVQFMISAFTQAGQI